MIRPRRTNRTLPPCLYLKSGRYWFVKRNKWHDFGTDHYEALKLYAEAHRPKSEHGMAKLLDEWLEEAGDTIKASTLAHYRSAVESKIKPAFLEFSPGEVESPDVAAFLYHHRKHPNGEQDADYPEDGLRPGDPAGDRADESCSRHAAEQGGQAHALPD